MNASIFNEVLGPIMIGPSSSHTAGQHALGRWDGSFWVNRSKK